MAVAKTTQAMPKLNFVHKTEVKKKNKKIKKNKKSKKK